MRLRLSVLALLLALGFSLGLGLPGVDNDPALTFDHNFAVDQHLNGRRGPPITFTRGSGATQFNSSGVLEYAPENLILESQTFDDGAPDWSPIRASVSANAIAAPDGTVTADKFVEDSSTNTHILVPGNLSFVSGTIYTYSIYAKAAERDEFKILLPVPANATATVDLDAESVVSGSGADTTSIEDVGDGWFRIRLTATAPSDTAGGSSIFLMSGGATSYNGDGSSGLYLWGAQIERHGSARTYNATTSAAFHGPRFDRVFDGSNWNPVGLLVEGARTNIFLQSEGLGTSPWQNSWSGGITLTTDNTTSPDGNTTADKIAGIDSSGDGIFQSIVLSTSTVYTISVFLKTSDSTLSRIQVWDVTGVDQEAELVITWTGATPSESSSSGASNITFTEVDDDWWRVSYSFTSDGTNTNHSFIIYPDRNNAQKAIWVWGTGLEAAAFPSSYIKTTTASVTRAASVPTETETAGATGTVYISARTAVGGGSQVLWQWDDGDENERFRIERNSSDEIRFIVTDGGVDQADLNLGTVADDTAFKVAVAWAANDFRGSLDGAAIVADTGGTVPAVTVQRFGRDTAGEEWFGTLAAVKGWNVALSNGRMIDQSTAANDNDPGTSYAANDNIKDNIELAWAVGQ